MNMDYREVEWIEMRSEDEDESGFNGLFDDPDPFDIFVHRFSIPPSIDSSIAESVKEKTHDNDERVETSELVVTLHGHKAEIGQTLNSTGLTLWKAAPILCNFLVANAMPLVSGKTVLELGAGLGLCGILAGMLQAKVVCMTDGDSESLKGMRDNVNRNISHESDITVMCRQLRWGINVEEFKLHIGEVIGNGGEFQIIMGSDIIYVESILDPLFSTVDQLLTMDASGLFILAYARRNVKIDLVLSTAEKFGFDWSLPDGDEGCYIFRRVQKEYA